MNLQSKKYKIQKGDTLKSVAVKFNINEYDLKSFHNTYCNIEDLIGIDFPKHLTELIVPSSELIKEEDQLNSPKPVRLGVKEKLDFFPASVNKNYGVLIVLENGNDSQTIKYEINLRYIRHEEKNKIFELNRISKVFINDEEADSIADVLAVKVAQVLYPLQILIDEYGSFSGIANYEQISERWGNVKEKIYDEYEGEWVEKYIELNEEVLNEKESIEFSLLGDYFIRTYFNRIYCEYPENKSKTSDIQFPVLNDVSDINYTVKTEIEEFYDESNFIVLNQNGVINDERSKEDLESKFDFPFYANPDSTYVLAEGTYRGKYFLNPNDRSIEAAYAEASVELEIAERVKISIANLNPKYNLNIQETDSKIFIGEKKELQKQNHFLID
ncbi:LysM peptidoglycan-binding domain-containing protein [Flavobacterium sp. H122]|uniref:LysM peptidoglycan-binding domain-containing protein n=1 Tax=Flavobacterium sp. H122 TaxID=2529860 RepID=UPI0010AB1DB3|nr:LysM peptidoglycan-binding domain-containing protein [Flavobacterium sp. H122]